MKKIFILVIAKFVLISVNAQITDIAPGNFKVIGIGTNPYSDNSKSVILLHEMYNGTLISKNYAIGEIYAFRGNAGANNRTNVAQVNTSSAYNKTYGSVISVNSDNKWALKTVHYNGKKYIAVHVPYRSDYHAHSFQFMGRAYSTGECVKLIVYEDNGSVINSEVAGSMQDFSPNMAEYHDVSKFIINSNLGVGTTNPGAKLELSGLGVNNANLRLTNTHANGKSWELQTGIVDISDSYFGIKNVTDGIQTLIINSNGNVAIAGKLEAKEIKVKLQPTADFVFNEDYDLRDIEAVEAFIKENKHLPDFPSGKEIEINGVDLGEMDAKLLQKIEELTLYLIGQQKEINTLKKQLRNKETGEIFKE